MPNGSSPKTLEDRIAALEKAVADLQDDLGKNNQNITDTLKKLIEALGDMKDTHCDLPPGCAM